MIRLILTSLGIFLCLLLSSQHLDVEGNVKIRGKIDVFVQGDSTSIFIGKNAGDSVLLSSIRENTFIGTHAGRSTTTGSANTFFGHDAGSNNTSGSDNAFFGQDSGRDNTTGRDNSFFGENAGRSNTTASENSFFGKNAGLFNTTGNDNSFFGQEAGRKNEMGNDNSFFGTDAGIDNTEGSQNSFYGRSSGAANITGSSNTAIGYFSSGGTSGTNNTSIGKEAGNLLDEDSHNTFIGTRADKLTGLNRIDSSVAIGLNAKVDCSKCAVLGDIGPNALKVGLGTNNPSHFLTIAGSSINNQADMAITSNDALIELGIGEDGPHGIIYGDNTPGQGMKIFYRSDPNAISIEPGNDISQDSSLFRFTLGGRMFASELPNIGDFKNMQYNDATGEIGYDNSSRRYKVKIAPLTDNWNQILNVRPVRYSRKSSPSHLEIGYIAEDIDELGLSYLVGYDQQGIPDDVRYDRMVLYLIEIIKTHERRIAQLEK